MIMMPHSWPSHRFIAAGHRPRRLLAPHRVSVRMKAADLSLTVRREPGLPGSTPGRAARRAFEPWPDLGPKVPGLPVIRPLGGRPTPWLRSDDGRTEREGVMAKPVRRQGMLRTMFPDLPESPRTAVLAFSSAQTFRVEELVRDNHYLIRAELPGLDPAKDIEVSVDGRTLTIHAERRQQDDEPICTEFRYGSLTRSVRLPAGVDAPDITARYRKGILEVSFPVPAAEPEGTRIPIEGADVPGSNETTKAAAKSAAASRVPGAAIPATPPSVSPPAQ